MVLLDSEVDFTETSGSNAEDTVVHGLQLVHIYTELTVSNSKHEWLFNEGGIKNKLILP